MKFSFEVNLEPIQMPNFIPTSHDKDGEVWVPVQDLTDEQAWEYAEILKSAFIEHWRTKCNEYGVRGEGKEP